MKTTQLIDKFAQQIAALPAVQALIQQENDRSAAEVYEARVTCLSKVRALRSEEETARADLEAANLVLKNTEAKLEPIRQRVCVASNKLSEINGKRQLLESALQKEHGENHVSHCLYLLQLLRDQRVASITYLTAALNPAVMVGDRIEFRFVDPLIRPRIEMEKKQLAAIEAALAAANNLVEIDMSPGEIETHTRALLSASGYRPNLPHPTDTDAATVTARAAY
jgi:DNA repair exonuclease SbcCD ATPase subunit